MLTEQSAGGLAASAMALSKQARAASTARVNESSSQLHIARDPAAVAAEVDFSHCMAAAMHSRGNLSRGTYTP